VKFAAHGPEWLSGGLDDVEVLQKRDAIAGHVEHPAACARAKRRWNQRAEERLKEVQPDRVGSGRNRDGVAEIAVPLVDIEVSEFGSVPRVLITPSAPIDLGIVGTPANAIGIEKIGPAATCDPDRL